MKKRIAMRNKFLFQVIIIGFDEKKLCWYFKAINKQRKNEKEVGDWGIEPGSLAPLSDAVPLRYTQDKDAPSGIYSVAYRWLNVEGTSNC